MADNLDLPQVMASQNNKEVTINDATTQLSSAMTDDISYDLTSASHTVTEADLQSYVMFIAINNSVSRTLTFPADKRSWFMVWNQGTATLAVACGSTSFNVSVGYAAAFRLDGTTNGLFRLYSFQITSSSGGGGGELDGPVNFSGRPLTSQQANIPLNRKVTLPSGLTGTQMYCGTNPTSTMTFTLNKNGSSIGTIAISTIGGFTVTFSSLVTFNPGDVFNVTAPNPRDATGADISFNFNFTLV